MSKLESIRYQRGHLEILDQLKIPREHLYIEIKNTQQGKKIKCYKSFNWRLTSTTMSLTSSIAWTKPIHTYIIYII